MSYGKSLWPMLSPEINLGHLLQAVVILLTIGGGAITSYLSLRSDLQQVRADLTVRVSEHEVRLATIEHSQAKISAERCDANSRVMCVW